jgi:hypothetical protein
LICQVCGLEAATRDVTFHQTIGAVVVRQTSSVKGHLCKSCIDKFFWDYTKTTALLGWWGVLSCMMTPFILFHNVRQYRASRGMEPPSLDAPQPVLTAGAIDRLRPHAMRMIERLNRGDKAQDVVAEAARLAEVTPGQVVLFIRELMPAQAQNSGLAPRSDDEL